MRWHLLLLATLVPWVVFAVEPTDVSAALEDIRDEYDVPALAAAAFDEGELVAIGAHGVRSTKRSSEVTDQDLWLLSSCTKSMTASLAAMLVEEGTIHWNSTIADVFPELCDCIDALWNHVTLEQLLVHRGGAPHNPPSDLLRIAELRKGTPAEQRMEFITSLLVREPSAEPGSKWIYSDSGYCIAGAMLERMGGKPYEQLLQERIFTPLGLKSAGFGPPATPGTTDQPVGHRGYEAPFKPVGSGPGTDYPPIFAPAATVHMSITDFARYANWHVQGDRGGAPLLHAESFKKLHTAPDGQDYAMGWAVTTRKWAGGTALMHSGENTNSYAVMWLSPKENTCFVATCNADCADAATACDAAITMLINRF